MPRRDGAAARVAAAGPCSGLAAAEPLRGSCDTSSPSRPSGSPSYLHLNHASSPEQAGGEPDLARILIAICCPAGERLQLMGTRVPRLPRPHSGGRAPVAVPELPLCSPPVQD